MPPEATRGAILVGGASRRLGRDKALELVGGVPLAERVRRALSEVVGHILVVGKAGRRNPLPDLPWIEDRHPGDCALAGVVEALSGADPRPVLLVACDHPFLLPGLLRLLGGPMSAAVRVPRVGGRLQPLVAMYDPARCLHAFERRLARGDNSIREALEELDLEVVEECELREIDPELDSFLNVNRPEDLERARRMAGKS